MVSREWPSYGLRHQVAWPQSNFTVAFTATLDRGTIAAGASGLWPSEEDRQGEQARGYGNGSSSALSRDASRSRLTFCVVFHMGVLITQSELAGGQARAETVRLRRQALCHGHA